jgi:F0F1-type ATP synthase assembly protein I
MAYLGGNRSLVSAAVNWASRVTSIALEMTVPPILGVWVDRKLGTGFVFLSLGAILGFITGMMSVWGIAKTLKKQSSNHHRD